MPFKNRLFLFGLLVLLAALLAIVFAPVAVSNGLRLWVWWKSRQEGLTVSSSEMRVQDGPTLILLRNGTFSASEVEAGRFSAGELMVASPWLRQTFSQLRGATRWDAHRLTLAGLTLARGLDLESVSIDFSRLGSQQVGLEFDADVFGGKIRGNIAHEWHSPRYSWKIAGAATDMSLAQTSEAIGLTDNAGGLIRACNLTLSRNLEQPDHVVSSSRNR